MRIVLATSLWARLAGLLDTRVCAAGEALLLAPCKSIHSFGMRSNIDVAFIDKNALILVSERDVPAGCLRSHSRAVAVLERRSCPHLLWPKTGERLQIQTLTGQQIFT
ncbi:MAG: DUF192 domain-containing protein [Coriobacteriales bacterium]|jgi:uncharacterized membrane protein (UPF0127 family)|nr:DUF192 domain-containing protein [Coriobacteriales bacterium]